MTFVETAAARPASLPADLLVCRLLRISRCLRFGQLSVKLLESIVHEVLGFALSGLENLQPVLSNVCLQLSLRCVELCPRILPLLRQPLAAAIRLFHA